MEASLENQIYKLNMYLESKIMVKVTVIHCYKEELILDCVDWFLVVGWCCFQCIFNRQITQIESIEINMVWIWTWIFFKFILQIDSNLVWNIRSN